MGSQEDQQWKETLEAISQFAEYQTAQWKAALKKLHPGIPYGAMMTLGQELWRESLIEQGYPPGGEFIVGPCVTMTVPCECEDPVHCEWCCGCGWLTKHVKEVKDSQNDSS